MFRGSGVKREQVTEHGIPCVRYGEIYTKYNYHFDNCYSHTLAEYVSSPKYFEYGNILFAITGESVEEIGKSIAYTGNEKCIAGGDIVVMKHNQEPRYISYALSTPSAIKQKGHGKTKLKVVHTNIPSLKEIIIPIAPINEQVKIADTLDTLKSKVDRLQANYEKISAECDALKQAILRQVFE
jgi:Type I restriction modification DNA specificity domain.